MQLSHFAFNIKCICFELKVFWPATSSAIDTEIRVERKSSVSRIPEESAHYVGHVTMFQFWPPYADRLLLQHNLKACWTDCWSKGTIKPEENKDVM